MGGTKKKENQKKLQEKKPQNELEVIKGEDLIHRKKIEGPKNGEKNNTPTEEPEKKKSILKILQFIFSEIFNIGFQNPQADNDNENLFMLSLFPYAKIKTYLHQKIISKKEKKRIRKLEAYGTGILLILKILVSVYFLGTQINSYLTYHYFRPELGFFGYYSFFTTITFTLFSFYHYFSLLVQFFYFIYLLGRFFNESYGKTNKIFKYLNFICWNWYVFVAQSAVCVSALYNFALLPHIIVRYGTSKVFTFDNISLHYVQTIIALIEYLILGFMKMNLIQVFMLPFIGCGFFVHISLLTKFGLAEMPYDELLVVETEEGLDWFIVFLRVLFVLIFVFCFFAYFFITFIRGIAVQEILKKLKFIKKKEVKKTTHGKATN